MSRRRRHTKEFKLAALARLETAPAVAGLAAELGINRGLLYKWSRAFRAGGASALRLPGEAEAGALDAAGGAGGLASSPSAQARIAALERKVGQQALEPDFFAQPCSTSRLVGGRRTLPTRRALRRDPGAERVARRPGDRASVPVGVGEPGRLLPALACERAGAGSGGAARYDPNACRWSIASMAIVGSRSCCVRPAGR